MCVQVMFKKSYILLTVTLQSKRKTDYERKDSASKSAYAIDGKDAAEVNLPCVHVSLERCCCIPSVEPQHD